MSNARGCLTWIGRVVLIVVVLLALLAGAGYLWQQSAEAADGETYPAAGELYTVDGRTMHLHCEGEGDPVVVLDAGLGGWSADYETLQPELAEQTRTCAYDRAGYGWSDPADRERHAQAIADDLVALLDAADITQPIILAGFSYSGLSSRLLTIQHPDRVAGLILLDPAHESDVRLYQGELAQQQQSLVGLYGLFGSLAEFGVVRFLEPEEMAPYAPFIPVDKSERYYAGLAHPQWWRTSQQEFAMMISGAGADQVIAAGALPSDIPLVVIGADDADAAADGEMAAFNEQRLVSLQALAAQSERGEFILAEDTVHDDIIKRVDLIEAVVAQMLETVTAA